MQTNSAASTKNVSAWKTWWLGRWRAIAPDALSTPRPLRWWLTALGLAALGAVLLALVLVAGLVWARPTTDLARWKSNAEAQLSIAVGRPVQIDRARLTWGLRPRLSLQGLRIANAAGFSSQPLLSIEEAVLAVAPADALRARYTVHDASFKGVRLSLESQDAGRGQAARNNWTLKPRQPDDMPSSKAFLAALPLELLAKLVVEQARLNDLQVSYSRTSAEGQTQRQAWQLPVASLQAKEDQTLVFEADGGCPAADACVLRLDAAPLSTLNRVAAGQQVGWPVSLNLRRGPRVGAFTGELRLDSANGYFAAAVPQAQQDLADLGVRFKGPAAQEPLAGAFAVALQVSSQGLVAKDFQLALGPAQLTGEVTAELGSSRPRVNASLDLQQLDALLEGLLGGTTRQPSRSSVVPRQAQPQGLKRLYDGLSGLEVDFGFLSRLDASVHLRMPRFHALGIEAEAISLKADLKGGRLTAPLAVTLWGTPFEAQLDASAVGGRDGAGDMARARLVLQSKAIDAGQLARNALNIRAVQGSAEQVLISFDASGQHLSHWLKSLDMVLLLQQARLGWQRGALTGTPQQADIRQLVVRWAGSEPLAGSLDAQLQGHELRATLSGNSLEDLVRHERLHLSLTMRSEDVTLNASAAVSQLGHEQLRPDVLWLDIQAPRASAVAGWFGLNTQAELPLSLQALLQAQAGPNSPWVMPLRLHAGQTEVNATATHTLAVSSPQGRAVSLGHTQLALHVPRLHVADIDALLPVASPQPAQPAAQPPVPAKRVPERLGAPTASTTAKPSLPTALQTFQGALSVRIDEVAGSRVPLRGIGFVGELREGLMPPAPLAAVIDDKPVSGSLALDLRREWLADITLKAEQPDFSRLARRLGLNLGFDLGFESLNLQAQARGQRLADWLANTTLTAEVQGGRFSLRDTALERTYAALIERGVVTVLPRQPIRFALAVSNTDRQALQTATLTLQSASLPILLSTNEPVPLTARADLGTHFIELDALASRALKGAGAGLPTAVRLSLKAGGRRLDELNRALGVTLPAWGPWSLSSQIDSIAGSHQLRGLRLQVGTSAVVGTASWAQQPLQRPRLTVELDAPRLTLADFPLAGWSPLTSSDTVSKAGPATTPLNPTAIERSSTAAQRGDALLAAGTLERQDLDLALRVGSVVLGGEGPERNTVLGSGLLQAQVNNGNLQIGPAILGLPGGQASLSVRFNKTTAGKRLAQAELNLSRFDYSTLARWYAPQALRDARGELSVSAQASASVAELSELTARGQGHVSARLYPRQMSSQRIDIWAVNLLTALLPTVDGSTQPQVNCVVADLALANGHLRAQRMALDTSGMRVTGSGSVNLLAPLGVDAYAMRFQPQAKEAQFFSLATPVAVSGPLLQPKVGVSAGDVAATALRLATSLVWVPLQKLAGRSLPADGADLCGVSR